MVAPGDGTNQTPMELVAKAHEESERLKEILQELREKKPDWASEVADEIATNILKQVQAGSNTAEKRIPVTQAKPSPARKSVEENRTAPRIIKVGIRSYFEPKHVSSKELNHRGLKATLVDDVILCFLHANLGNNPPVIYQDIADELDRLKLHEDRNTTYGRISRLRERGLVSESNPKSKGAYSLTDKGSDYVTDTIFPTRSLAGHA
jgi:hypothetical protein